MGQNLFILNTRHYFTLLIFYLALTTLTIALETLNNQYSSTQGSILKKGIRKIRQTSVIFEEYLDRFMFRLLNTTERTQFSKLTEMIGSLTLLVQTAGGLWDTKLRSYIINYSDKSNMLLSFAKLRFGGRK